MIIKRCLQPAIITIACKPAIGSSSAATTILWKKLHSIKSSSFNSSWKVLKQQQKDLLTVSSSSTSSSFGACHYYQWVQICNGKQQQQKTTKFSSKTFFFFCISKNCLSIKKVHHNKFSSRKNFKELKQSTLIPFNMDSPMNEFGQQNFTKIEKLWKWWKTRTSKQTIFFLQKLLNNKYSTTS